jgi:hypothetical protein
VTEKRTITGTERFRFVTCFSHPNLTIYIRLDDARTAKRLFGIAHPKYAEMKAGLGETGLEQKSQCFWDCIYSFGYLLVYAKARLGMALIMILFQAVFGRGLSEILHSGLPAWTLLLGVPFTYVWLLVEVGLVEEFFFRCLLQSRLSTVLRSKAGGIVLASLLFCPRALPGSLFSSRGDAGGCRRPSILADGGGLLHHDHIRGWRLHGCVVGPNTKPHFGRDGPCCQRLVAKPCANHQELAVALPSGAFSVPESCHLSQRSESHA